METTRGTTPHATRHTPLLRAVLSLLLLLVFDLHAAQKKILFYGPTHQPGGVGETMVNSNPTEFYPIGQGSAVWTPGDSNAALDWSKKTVADFQAFDAIVIGELGEGFPEQWTGAIANRHVWSLAVAGDNVLIFGGDPEGHASGRPGALKLIEEGIRFVADGGDPGPGLFIQLSDTPVDAPSPVDPTQPCAAHLLSGLGEFSLTHAHYEKAHKLYSHPVTDCLSDADLSDWGQSSHSGFKGWPVDFVPLALMTDAPPNNRTPTALLPPGVSGLVHILAKGSFKQFRLSPSAGGRLVGGTHTVTATYLSETGQPMVGTDIRFTIPAGDPNAESETQDRTGLVAISPSGTASWTYTGNNPGFDRIIATVENAPGCPPNALATCLWRDQAVSITATDPASIEPSTENGAANTGTFTLTRSGNITQELTVIPVVSGTADGGMDYAMDTSVTFAANQAAQTLTVTPVYDGLSEAPETVVLSLRADKNNDYVPGNPDEAAVTIQSSTYAQVSLTVIDGSIDETGNNHGRLRLARSDGPGSIGAIEVLLGFGGTATYRTDYILVDPSEDSPNGWDTDGKVILSAGQAWVDLDLYPIPDTRAEGIPGETIVISVQPSDHGTYGLGSPASQTLTLLEDSGDTAQIPPNGWEVKELGYYYGTPNNDYYEIYAMGINTLPDGAGGWKGQVVGDLYYYSPNNSYYPGPEGFRWDNGSWLFHPNVARHYGSFWTARAINDAGTIVGWDATSYYGSGRAYAWRNGVSTLLPMLPSTSYHTAVDLNQWQPLQTYPGGIIVGTVTRSAPYRTQTVAWVPNANGNYTAAPIEIQDLAGGNRNSTPTAINQWGEVVGKSQTDSGNHYHAFRSREVNGTPQPLFGPQDDMGTATFVDTHSSEANDLNDYGELVGASQTPAGQYRAVYKAPYSGKNVGYADLGVLGTATSSVATGINNRGLIVGTSGGHAFVASNVGSPGTQPLLKLAEKSWVKLGNNWYRADLQGWTFNGAKLKLNEANWIVGYGVRYGTVYGFALKPRP